MADEQYIAAHVAAYPADKGRVLVSHRGTGRPDILRDQLFDILRHADRFDTLRGHEKRLFASGWEDDGSGFVKSALQELVSRGFLVSKSTFLASLHEETGTPVAPPRVTSVLIPTRDRLPQLQRCLASLIETSRRHDRHPDYVVVDDSRQKGQAEQLGEILAQFAAGGSRVSRAGREEKTKFAGELVRVARSDGLPRDVVAFALSGDEGHPQTYGASRNAILLASPGELCVMVDDDIVCQSAVPDHATTDLVLEPLKDPTICHFHKDRKHLAESVRIVDVDILSSHEKLLGRSIAGCLATLGPKSAFDVDHLTPQSVHFFASAPRTVRATMSGSWGDSGMDTPQIVLALTGPARDALMRSREHYGQAKECREVFRSVPCYTISDAPMFVTMNAGVDNRSLLPPFLPAGRHEDGVFAMTLRACDDDACIGHIPLAVFHSPMEQRRHEQGLAPAAAPRLAEIILTVMGTFSASPAHSGVAERLSRLGKSFVEIGALKIADFRECVETSWMAAASRRIAQLEGLLDQYRAQPDYWADDVLAFIDKLADVAVRGSTAAPRELLGEQSTEQAMETCRRLVRRYGELLQWWPCIWNAARTLRADGIRLATPVTSSSG
jgi:hypothetical protein